MNYINTADSGTNFFRSAGAEAWRTPSDWQVETVVEVYLA